MKPFVKWAGGKRQILNQITSFIDKEHYTDFTYIEPFLGGGAVFFGLQPERAIINDLNSDLINAYEVIKSEDYLGLIDSLERYSERYRTEDKNELYYDVRALDRDVDNFAAMSKVDRAARMIFLNRTCYNGLYRVNNNGFFNTPMGRYNNPLICDKENIIEIHNYLKKNKIRICNTDYENIINMAKDGDVIYLDPPYDYQDDDGFTKYQLQGFAFDDFVRLKKACDQALLKGAYVIISNNATDKVLKLFEEDINYNIYVVNKINTLRSINCNGSNRKSGEEVIIYGLKKSLPQANNIESIINVLMCEDDDIISNSEKMKLALKVGTERQRVYYLAAMGYLKLISSTNQFTEKAMAIRGNRKAIDEYIFSVLISSSDGHSELYNYAKFGNNSIKEEAIRIIKGHPLSKRISSATLERRASSMAAWVRWMLSIQ